MPAGPEQRRPASGGPLSGAAGLPGVDSSGPGSREVPRDDPAPAASQCGSLRPLHGPGVAGDSSGDGARARVGRGGGGGGRRGSPRRRGPLPGSHPHQREEAAKRPATAGGKPSWGRQGLAVLPPRLPAARRPRETGTPMHVACHPSPRSPQCLALTSHPASGAVPTRVGRRGLGTTRRGRERKVSFRAPSLPTGGGCSFPPCLSLAAPLPHPHRGGFRGSAACLRAGARGVRGEHLGPPRSPRSHGG